MQIDRPDLADEFDGARTAHHARAAADDPGAAGKDRGNAVGGDDPPDLSPSPLDSSVCTERAAAYRATVDAAYRQYAIDRGRDPAEDNEPEMAAPAMCRIEAEDPQPYLAETIELENPQVPDRTTSAAQIGLPSGEHDLRVRDRTSDFSADDVQSGARGPASGREFNPEAAGGPIQQLDAGKARITKEGVHEAAAHLQRFAAGGPLEAPEQAMLDRLTSIAAGDMDPTFYDLNFYTHELDEAARYAQLGFGPETGVDLGSPTMYDLWNDVHTAALEDYGISGADLFHPGLAP